MKVFGIFLDGASCIVVGYLLDLFVAGDKRHPQRSNGTPLAAEVWVAFSHDIN